MSATSQVAVLGTGRLDRRERRTRRRRRRWPGPSLTLVSYALLAAYGALRWDTMIAHVALGRTAGLLALAVGIAACGAVAHADDARLRALAIVAIVIGALAMIPMAGLPLSWALHVRIAVTARAIGHGLSALPGVIVPYRGGDFRTRAVIELGAGMLMLGGALTLATSRRPLGELRLAGAALPMVVLAIVPSALARPQFAYLHGVLLFGLLALFIFSERLSRARAVPAAGFLALAAVAAMILTPALDSHSPLVKFETVATGTGPGHGESFNWSQTYGPLSWPDSGRTVLDVRAAFPSYWKAENLDLFNGRAWQAATVGLGDALNYVTPANLRRWEQVLTVTVRDMTTNEVIAAGTAGTPGIASGTLPGDSPGTYLAREPLEPGDSYEVTVYTPRPTESEEATAGTNYPISALAPDLDMLLPYTSASATTQTPIAFNPYGSSTPVQNVNGTSPEKALATLEASPYGRAYELAASLKANTSTPYEYVEAVLRYLSQGFTYDQSPPASQYPLLSFLFGNKLGYCQQFAGAMALLLRMGGVPARVAVGFSTGQTEAPQTYQVSDLDAHAWVEAWFPGYGWVTFDPTPAQDGVLGVDTPAGQSKLNNPTPAKHAVALKHPSKSAGSLRAVGAGGGRGGGADGGLIVAIVLVLGLAGGGLLFLRRRRVAPPDVESRIAELERAFARCGRPLPGGVTLTALEGRLADTPDAAEYVRRLRDARFAGDAPAPTLAQRRALRTRLRRGLGVIGWVRALIALPPRAG